MEFIGVCLVTDDVPALAAFYDGILGTKSDINSIHTQINVAGAFLAIYARDAAREDMLLRFTAQPGSFTLQFGTENVDALHKRLQEMGAEIVKEPTTYPWGSRSMQARDPDGNIVTFA